MEKIKINVYKGQRKSKGKKQKRNMHRTLTNQKIQNNSYNLNQLNSPLVYMLLFDRNLPYLLYEQNVTKSLPFLGVLFAIKVYAASFITASIYKKATDYGYNLFPCLFEYPMCNIIGIFKIKMLKI